MPFNYGSLLGIYSYEPRCGLNELLLIRAPLLIELFWSQPNDLLSFEAWFVEVIDVVYLADEQVEGVLIC